LRSDRWLRSGRSLTGGRGLAGPGWNRPDWVTLAKAGRRAAGVSRESEAMAGLGGQCLP